MWLRHWGGGLAATLTAFVLGFAKANGVLSECSALLQETYMFKINVHESDRILPPIWGALGPLLNVSGRQRLALFQPQIAPGWRKSVAQRYIGHRPQLPATAAQCNPLYRCQKARS